jgi:hypothetical protein
MHLRLDLRSAFDAGENRHAVEIMRALGIAYEHATPQSIADQWWFWNCSNVPAPLPRYITTLDLDPHQAIGHGLDQQTADRLTHQPSEVKIEQDAGR